VGRYYGVTCAHVAHSGQIVLQAASCDGGKPPGIGTVLHSEMPPLFSSSALSTSGYPSIVAKPVDAALIEIDNKLGARLEINSLGSVAGIFPDANIVQWLVTTYGGRTSGIIRIAEFRGRSPYYCLADKATGQIYCFDELLTIRWTSSAGKSTGPFQDGDSGSWLGVDGLRGWEWAAMAVGGDSNVGFAVSATRVEAWWKSLGLNSLSPN
jgi:hypothetical protein